MNPESIPGTFCGVGVSLNILSHLLTEMEKDMNNSIPPICPGTEDHFESHRFSHDWEPVLLFWADHKKPRFWSHDSDYPWRFDDLKQYERTLIARHQACAWYDLSTENGDEAHTNSHLWRAWEKE